MNRTKNTIGWCDFSWNPVTGCKHGCFYCYAKKLCLRFKKIFPNGFEPTFHPERLHEPYELKKPSKIFVCSIADLFAPWTNEGWTNVTLAAMLECPIPHTFQMLTKNPERIMDNWILKQLSGDGFTHAPSPNTLTTTRGIPENWWFGTTVTGENNDVVNIEAIKNVESAIRFVSFEPLLGNIDLLKHSLKGIQWVIIGKLTGSKRVKLQPEWVENIIDEADRWNIPIFEKKNLQLESPRQEFPC